MNVAKTPLSTVDHTSASSHVNDQVPERDLPFYRRLGRTELLVSCLGVGGGCGISSADTLYAFDQGINYFFYSSDLHHFMYSSMADALRALCGHSSAVREHVILATATYLKDPNMILSVLVDQFMELNIDYVDILFWGCIGDNDGPVLRRCLEESRTLTTNHSFYLEALEQLCGNIARVRESGLVRYIGASFHSIDVAREWLHSPLLDVVMVRHNPGYRVAQRQVLSQLDPHDSRRPGIVTFKSNSLYGSRPSQSPPRLPPGCWHPTAPDCYRYSLSQHGVDLCLTGLRSQKEIDAAIGGVSKGKLTVEESDYLSLYGDLCHNRVKLENTAPRRLLYRS